MTSDPGSVSLRRLGPRDEPAFLNAVRRSRRLHHPWAYPPDTSRAFTEYIVESPARAPLVVVDEDELAGVYTLSQIHLGPFRNAYLGF